MFERRLRILLGVLTLALAVLLGRLAHLQVVRADHYRKLAERSITVTPKQTPFVRGAILDRTGEILVSDRACWEIKVDFGVIAVSAAHDGHDDRIKREMRRFRCNRRYPGATTDEQVELAFLEELEACWADLARFAQWTSPLGADGGSVATKDPRAVAHAIYEKVMRVRTIVTRYRGFDAPVAEERQAHAVVGELDTQQQIAAREMFAGYPWVHVAPSSARTFYHDSTPFAHVLGRLGRVDAEDVAADPAVDDPFAAYRADESLGVSGVEYLAERTLRGRRGEMTIDRDGTVIDEIEAENGRDVTLTIHASLQRRLYRLLGDTVRRHPDSSGGAIVVLDVPSREVLALVSYPSYDPSLFVEEYSSLRDDTESLPLRFRAVTSRYPPGSTIKPLACLAGLMNRRITLDSRQRCTGYLFDNVRNRWRCWEVHGTGVRKAHGDIDVVEALTGSCNVFMYRLGQDIGVDRLCAAFDMAGIGRTTGIGLCEENLGINPTPDWLMTHKNTPVTPGTARLFAIGQGELAMTPVQVANLFAVYASGRWRAVTLIPSEEPAPQWTLPATDQQWNAIRRGIYGVVNDPEGTAHKHAFFENERYALCGKTGSATAHPWPTSFRIPYTDENGESAVAIVSEGSKGPAIERFQREHPTAAFDRTEVEVAGRWPSGPPAEGSNHSHAWFGGFLQPINTSGQPDWSKAPQVAFAVLVEFGGSGGRTSGPLAKRVAAELLDVFGPDLNVLPMNDGMTRR